MADICEQASQEVSNLSVSGDGNPSRGMGQDRACSILSHRHSLGSPGGGELYLTQSAFERAPLCRVNPCLTIGSAVSQL